MKLGIKLLTFSVFFSLVCGVYAHGYVWVHRLAHTETEARGGC